MASSQRHGFKADETENYELTTDKWLRNRNCCKAALLHLLTSKTTKQTVLGLRAAGIKRHVPQNASKHRPLRLQCFHKAQHPALDATPLSGRKTPSKFMHPQMVRSQLHRSVYTPRQKKSDHEWAQIVSPPFIAQLLASPTASRRRSLSRSQASLAKSPGPKGERQRQGSLTLKKTSPFSSGWAIRRRRDVHEPQHHARECAAMLRSTRRKLLAELRPLLMLPMAALASTRMTTRWPCRERLRHTHFTVSSTPWHSRTPEWAGHSAGVEMRGLKSPLQNGSFRGTPSLGTSGSSPPAVCKRT